MTLATRHAPMDPEKVLLQPEVPQKSERALPPKKSRLLLRCWTQSVAEGSVKDHVDENVVTDGDMSTIAPTMPAGRPQIEARERMPRPVHLGTDDAAKGPPRPRN